jgi:hypothetical protein
MGRSVVIVFGLPSIIVLVSLLSGCSSSNGVNVVNFPTPANVVLNPATTASMDVGATLTFTAIPEDNTKKSLVQPVTYFSDNPAVVTVAANGIACAGTWDSLSFPQVCTPGPAGVAQISASAQGVSSPPTTVYVHQHIDSISIGPVPTQANPTSPCVTKGQTFEYAAKALSRGSDITSTVGQFNWTSLDPTVVTLSTTASGLFKSQAQATAMLPGVSSMFASVGSVNSTSFNFVTCPVQSISLSVNGIGGNLLTLAQGSTQTITATVMDSMKNAITGVPLKWSSSQPTSVGVAAGTVTAVTITGTITASAVGGASVVASCTPPTCNIGFQPSLAIYPQSSIGVVVTPISTSIAASGTLFVTTDGCQTIIGCITTLVPVTLPANTIGTATNLPAVPDSLVLSPDATTAYLGTDLGQLGTKGLMKFVVSGASLSQNTSVAGKVVAVSPDGNKLVISDIVDPNSSPQVFIFDTVSNTATAFPVAAGTTNVAADFSPDSLKAFVVAGNGSASTLYVYSKVDPLQTIPLTTAGAGVAFLQSGNFGYIAAGTIPELSLVPTCDNPPPGTAPLIQTTPTTAPPLLVRPVVSGKMATAESPGVEFFTPTVNGSGCAFPRPYPGASGSPSIPGDLTVSNTASFFNLGAGNFIPRQLIISQDGSAAYIVANDPNNNPLGVILVFNIGNQTSSAISLAGNAIPLQAALTPDGTVLYVGASDGTVHAVSTVAGGDFQQIPFPLGLCLNSAGQPFVGATCNPDRIAITP